MMAEQKKKKKKTGSAGLAHLLLSGLCFFSVVQTKIKRRNGPISFCSIFVSHVYILLAQTFIYLYLVFHVLFDGIRRSLERSTQTAKILARILFVW
jgi:hypothetical protein